MPESSPQWTIPAERRAALADVFRVGRHLIINDPLPVAGQITEHVEHGIKLRKADGLPAYVSWALLSTARVQRSFEVDPSGLED